MSKRKLTRRQQWRIDKIQEERAQRARQRDDKVDQQLEASDLGPEEEGLIVSHFGTQVEVEVIENQAQVRLRCHLRANLGQLVTGDKVIIRRGPETGVVVAVLPRKSELERPNPYGEMKPVAANIDFIVITVAIEPTPFANLIDRYLVAAELSGIEPVLLFNKSDLLSERNQQDVETLLQRYQGLGYRTLLVSVKNSVQMQQLEQLLAGHISVFVGQSGVGKSSLINTLLPNADQQIGELSQLTRKGRHTTTTARLFHFPSGGDLIDSPGIREFGLWHISEHELISGFRELAHLAGECRFRDCRHQAEPGCALLAAVAEGQVDQLRWQSYQQILNTLENLGR